MRSQHGYNWAWNSMMPLSQVVWVESTMQAKQLHQCRGQVISEDNVVLH